MEKSNLIKTVFFLLIITFITPLRSQQNVIKAGLVDLFKINLGFERAINHNQSAQVNFAFYRPRNLPSFLIPDEIDDKNLKGRFFGYSIIPEYRFYFSPKESPRGFYIAPYLKYSNYSMTGTDIISNEFYKVKGTFSSLGIGAQLGAQWIVSDVFTIDWYFLGIEIDRDALSLKYTADSANPDFEKVRSTIETIYSSIPIVGSALKKLSHISTGNNSIKAKLPWFMPDIRAGLSIGYAF